MSVLGRGREAVGGGGVLLIESSVEIAFCGRELGTGMGDVVLEVGGSGLSCAAGFEALSIPSVYMMLVPGGVGGWGFESAGGCTVASRRVAAGSAVTAAVGACCAASAVVVAICTLSSSGWESTIGCWSCGV